ncbi:MAG: xanthine dehydrogenase family protein [Gammaproteobacteria bacterium]|nr:xanthine dehydrogenase family protein [Gammaproteobacteria bacterium]MYF27980.1 xanthine dehydrogenase family protein [Gammaproteobacteria bacterium]MYK45121.1 xanthine dehydrogenase family protein [Gammaproteobacteria bacterium]
MASETGIGASVKRKEDARFITGAGNYTDDINAAGQTYAVFVRSPYARAKINGVDTAAAAATDGVVAVFTGADLAADEIGDLPCGWLVKSKDGSDMVAPPHPPIATQAVNYVGEPYAVVIGETLEAARNGAEAVDADFEELPAVVDLSTAASADQIHESVPNNQAYDWELGDKAATDAAFDSADHVATVDIVNNRLIPNAIEPRAALGEYDAAAGTYTLHTTSQNPHLERLVLAAFVNVAPEARLRVISPDVGGGFGSKIFVYAEETAVIWAAGKVRRPVKWRAERSESFLADCHGRDHVTTAQLALAQDGKFLGLRVKTKANMGAYLSTFASSVPTYLYGTLMAGQYTTPAIYVEVQSLYTNTAPVDAYRGAGRPEATYVVERCVETAAREMGIDPAEIRRRNFIQPGDFPYDTPVALTYDTGDYEASLDKALEHIDYAGFGTRRAASESAGKKRGIGFSCYIEACGLAPSQVAISLGAGVGLFEVGEVRVDVTGSVTVVTGSHSHGQSHETTFAQIISDKLGVPFENVTVLHGDTGRSDYALGTYGSRSLAVGGSAIIKATDKIIAKGKKIAAHMLEAEEDQMEFADGTFTVADSNQSITFGEVAFSAYVPQNFPLEDLEPGLSEKAFYDPPNFTYPAGAHICEVEVDPDTGVVDIVDFVAVDDFGHIVNPMIVEGQVHGGLAQGIGQALFEHGVYDDTGQLVSGSYMDYTMPRADDLPSFTVDTTVTPCTHNPLGVKGCGEAGAIGSTAAVMNAVTDALGVASVPMPATPETVWRAGRGE